MAVQNADWAWSVVGVQGTEYVLLHFLVDQSDVNGLTPLIPVERLTRRCNCSRSAIFRHSKRLEAKGFIERTRHNGPDRSLIACSFQLNINRYFPIGDYSEIFKDWKRILVELAAMIKRNEMDKRRNSATRKARVSIADLQTLQEHVSEAVLQKNTRTLYLVSDKNNDQVKDAMYGCLGPLKEAAVTLELRIRRFELFRRHDRR